MDAVILTAGQGKRLRPLTDETPKSLLSICGKPTIEWILESLPATVERVVMVVHTHADQIRLAVKDPRVFFVDQPDLRGTFSALRVARTAIHTDSFLVLFGDNLYDTQDLARLSQIPAWAMGVMECRDSGSHLVVEDQHVLRIDRTAPNGRPRNVCIGAFHLDARIFDVAPTAIQGTVHREVGLPQTMTSSGVPIQAVMMTHWQPVGTPEEYAQAQSWR